MTMSLKTRPSTLEGKEKENDKSIGLGRMAWEHVMRKHLQGFIQEQTVREKLCMVIQATLQPRDVIVSHQVDIPNRLKSSVLQKRAT